LSKYSVFSRSGVEINFSDVNIVTEVEHFLPREQIFANTCSLGSFHFFDSCDKNLMGVFIFFDCCDKNLIVLSRQLLIPLNSSKDDNSFVIIFLFLKFEIFVLFLLPTVKKIVYILLERMLIFPSCISLPQYIIYYFPSFVNCISLFLKTISYLRHLDI
jgi:hypothetical protein